MLVVFFVVITRKIIEFETAASFLSCLICSINTRKGLNYWQKSDNLFVWIFFWSNEGYFSNCQVHFLTLFFHLYLLIQWILGERGSNTKTQCIVNALNRVCYIFWCSEMSSALHSPESSPGAFQFPRIASKHGLCKRNFLPYKQTTTENNKLASFSLILLCLYAIYLL